MRGDAVVLLVGGLVLLIDDEDGEIAERQEQSRARPGDDLHLALRDAGPDAGALARADAGMPFRRPRAEARRESVEELRRQRDLRHQDQRLPSLRRGFRDRLEIDLRLARAGDAFEQSDGEGARLDLGDEADGRLGRSASSCGGAKSVSQGAATGSGGSTTASSVPSSTSESITLVEQAARSANRFSSRRGRPPSRRGRAHARASSASAPARRGASRRGASPPPHRKARGRTCAEPCRAGSRSSARPNRRRLRRFPLSGGMSKRAATALRLLPRRLPRFPRPRRRSAACRAALRRNRPRRDRARPGRDRNRLDRSRRDEETSATRGPLRTRRALAHARGLARFATELGRETRK